MDFTSWLAVAGSILGIASIIISIKRNNKKDTEEDVKQNALVVAKLDSISQNVTDLKSEMREMNRKFSALNDWKIKAEIEIANLKETVSKHDERIKDIESKQ